MNRKEHGNVAQAPRAVQRSVTEGIAKQPPRFAMLGDESETVSAPSSGSESDDEQAISELQNRFRFTCCSRCATDLHFWIGWGLRSNGRRPSNDRGRCTFAGLLSHSICLVLWH